MAQPRRKPEDIAVVIPLGKAPRRLRAADGSEAPAASPVHDQVEQLNAAFATDEKPTLRSARYSGLVRAMIVVGGSLGLWAGLFAGASRLLALVR